VELPSGLVISPAKGLFPAVVDVEAEGPGDICVTMGGRERETDLDEVSW
jgi:hypothetical protein